MKTYHYHFDREIPVFAEPEVLVVGGGCAGLAAAVCAARRGHKTLLAERAYCLGGTATEGMVGPFMTCSDPSGKKDVIRGFFREFVDRLIVENGALEPMSIPNCEGYSSWPPCFALGQAAGNAAALALDSGSAPADIDVPELQRRLAAENVVLPSSL